MPLTHKYMTAHFPGLIQALQEKGGEVKLVLDDCILINNCISLYIALYYFADPKTTAANVTIGFVKKPYVFHVFLIYEIIYFVL